MKVKKILIGTIVILAILMPVKSNATLQANGSSVAKKRVSQWMPEIRTMESQGGTLGLTGSDSLNQELEEDNKVENSNNLDIHMQKNTEYGAMVILSASNYGKSTPVHEDSDGSLATTTGNKSGVYMNLSNPEWVAAGGLSRIGVFKNAQLKYKNVYNYQKEDRKIGDALFETAFWHKTGKSVMANWNGRDDSGLRRGYGGGSIFAYDNRDYTGGDYNPPAYASRAVVVIGARILKRFVLCTCYKKYKGV